MNSIFLFQSEDAVLNNLRSFDVQESHCYDPNEECNLRNVITAVGGQRFNESIRKLAEEVIAMRTRNENWKQRGGAVFSNTLAPGQMANQMMRKSYSSGKIMLRGQESC